MNAKDVLFIIFILGWGGGGGKRGGDGRDGDGLNGNFQNKSGGEAALLAL